MVICLTKHLLSDKHHFSKIWLAAHLERKIKKSQIYEVDIEKSIQEIFDAELILDLRISGHLLVGIVKIHSRKTKYLLHECSSIFQQVKIFHCGRIDLPENKLMAPLNDINLDGFLDNIENVTMLTSNIFDDFFTNQRHVEDITLKEASGQLLLLDDVDMIEFPFREEDEPIDDENENLSLLVQELDETALDIAPQENEEPVKEKVKKAKYSKTKGKQNVFVKNIFDLRSPIQFEIPESSEVSDYMNYDTIHSEANLCNVFTNLNQETVELNLEPLNVFNGNISSRKKLRKRKLLVDSKKCMPYSIIHKQILDTSDTTSALELAPPSKRIMYMKETGSANKLLCLPATSVKPWSSKILKLYERNLKTRQSDIFEVLSEGKEESVGQPRKKHKSSLLEEVVNINALDSFEASPILKNKNANTVVENDIPTLDNFKEFENIESDPVLESHFHLSEEISLNNDDMSSKNNIQLTQTSKTSAEKFQYALQGRIIEMLQCLKSLFQEKSINGFTYLTQKDKKLWVARKFFCLLMLKKFQVIRLEQSFSFGEIFITPDVNFHDSCLKFCCS